MSTSKQEIAPSSKTLKNGAEVKPNETPAEVKPNEGKEDGEEGKRTRGALPTMPHAMLYKLENKVHAVVFHPQNDTTYRQSGKGEGSAKGALEDSGFKLGALTADGPEWLSGKLPAGATLIGYANIKSFPLPAQD